MKLFLIACLTLMTGIAAAQTLPEPRGPVILTVSGAITNTNGDGIARLDRNMIKRMRQRTIRTSTPWYDGPQIFAGPTGQSLLDYVGATGTMLDVQALNDYAAFVPVQDFVDYNPILATHLNGDEMTIREKGPFFLIYPYDDDDVLFSEVYFGRSVWQIQHIEVLE